MSTVANDLNSGEVSLADYLLVLWRYRLPLLLVALLTAGIAFAVNSFREPVFEATAKLMVSPSKIGEVANPPVSVATFINLVDNRTLVLETLNELELSKPPYSLSLARVLNSHLRVEAVREANVIEVKAQFSEPELAATFANRLAERSVRLAGRLFQEDTVAARDTIKVQLDESKARLDAAQRRLEEFKKKAQVGLLTEDTDALLGLRANLAPLLVEIEEERGRIARITEELAQQEPVRNVRRSLDASSVVPGDARRAEPEGTDPDFRLRGELLDPYVNPVHDMLQQQLATSRARLSGLEKRRAEIMRVVGAGQAGVAKLSELYTKQAELERLQTGADLANRVYEEVSTRYEQARLQVAGRSPQLQVIDLATPPETRIGPRVLRNTVLAAALALVFASSIALLVAAVGGQVARTRGAALRQ